MIDIPISNWIRATGRLISVNGRVSATLEAGLGELVEITTSTHRSVLAEVIGFDHDHVQIMPFESGTDFRRGNLVLALGRKCASPLVRGCWGE